MAESNVMNITVFGGSTPNAHDYQQAEQLGRQLALSGHTVITGGYIGIMEAVSKGANEAGGHVIGITCDQIESWRPVKMNRWVLEERRFPTLGERLFALIEACQAAIALPGGPGTLTEISLTWNLLLTESIAPRPLIVVGESWEKTFMHLFDTFDGYIPKEQRRWLIFARDNKDAIIKATGSYD
jgi:uncharacterized protein (TIGR00730 family)